MKKPAAILLTILCLVFLIQSQEIQKTKSTEKWEKIWGPVGTVILGLDASKQTTLVYATELSSGDLYRYTGKWEKIGGPGAMFVADHSGHLYGLSPDRAGVYEFTGTPGKWSKVGGTAASIYAGGDKLFATNPQTGDIYGYTRNTKKWTRFGGPGAVFVVDSAGSLYGLAMDKSAVFRYTGTPGKWEKIGGPASMIFAGGDKLFAINPRSRDIYEYSGKSNTWSKAGSPGKKFTVGMRGHLFGISKEDEEAYMVTDGRGGRTKVGGAAEGIYAGIDKLFAIKPGTRELQVAATPIHLPKPYDNEPDITLYPQLKELLPAPLKTAEGYVTASPNLDLSAYYKIVSKGSGLYLDLIGWGFSEDEDAVQAYSHGGDKQRWKFVSRGGGFYEIVSKVNGRYLGVKDGSKQNGALVVLTKPDAYSTEEEHWGVIPVGEDDYRIVSRVSGKWMEVKGASKKEKAPIQQGDWQEGNHQLWKLKIATPEPCQHIHFEVKSIHVLKADDFGTFGEPGAYAEWSLHIAVNEGLGHNWRSEYVKDGTYVEPDWKWGILEPKDETFTVTIRAWGRESDSSSGDDQLPAASVTHTKADNWGIGKVGQLVGKNKDFHYIIEYTISCWR
ncbi:RICIN domain-containing protein [Acidobacteriota bacterium]